MPVSHYTVKEEADVNQKMKRKKIRKNTILLVVSTAVILFGLGITAENTYKILKGFFAYQTYENRKPPVAPSSLTDTIAFVNQTDLFDPKITLPIINNNGFKIKDSLSKTTALQQDKHTALYPTRPNAGDEIGQLEIPKLSITLPIYEGTDEDELEQGVGHFADSVLPGEDDNSVLAGHRDTVFRKLGEIGKGDLLIVRTSAGEFEYKVKKVRIVDKNDRTVIVPKPGATLTISTCYPFEYIGSAPDRYILVAYLASETLY